MDKNQIEKQIMKLEEEKEHKIQKDFDLIVEEATKKIVSECNNLPISVSELILTNLLNEVRVVKKQTMLKHERL